MEKYPRGTQGPFSIPLLIKAQILLSEKCGLGQVETAKDGLMWAVNQSHCSDALIYRHALSWEEPSSLTRQCLAPYQIHIHYSALIELLNLCRQNQYETLFVANNGRWTNATQIS